MAKTLGFSGRSRRANLNKTWVDGNAGTNKLQPYQSFTPFFLKNGRFEGRSPHRSSQCAKYCIRASAFFAKLFLKEKKAVFRTAAVGSLAIDVFVVGKTAPRNAWTKAGKALDKGLGLVDEATELHKQAGRPAQRVEVSRRAVAIVIKHHHSTVMVVLCALQKRQ